ncbi:hypothetical protein SMICM304S_02329 [Streptomyces microflavus]
MTRRPQGTDGDGPPEPPGRPERQKRPQDPAHGPEAALVAAVVRIEGRDGVVAGAGFLVADGLVLTCAHVVSDALAARDATVEPGAEVTVGLPLAGNAGDPDDDGDRTAEVHRWIPVRPDRTGDMALLRLRDPYPAPGRCPWPIPRRACGTTVPVPWGSPTTTPAASGTAVRSGGRPGKDGSSSRGATARACTSDGASAAAPSGTTNSARP